MKDIVETNFAIGQVVRHKHLDFRGVIFDVDPEFNNTEEWYQSIPAQIRPKKDQPFYHVYAENEEVFYTVCLSTNLLADNPPNLAVLTFTKILDHSMEKNTKYLLQN